MNTWIIAHGDCDGVASAALALHALGEGKIWFSHPAGLYSDLTSVVKKGDRVVVLDIAASENLFFKLKEKFNEITFEGRLIYIDHHPEPLKHKITDLPGELMYSTDSCTSELTYKFFEEKLPEDMSRVMIYGAIADYSLTGFVEEKLAYWDMRTVFFESGVLSQGLEGSRKEYDFKRLIVHELAQNKLPSEIHSLAEKAVRESKAEEEMRLKLKEIVEVKGNIAYVINPGGSLPRAAIYVRALTNALIGLACEERKEKLVMSLRTREERIDLNRILREITPQVEGTGGGHPKASGARIPKERFNDFIFLLNDKAGQVLKGKKL